MALEQLKGLPSLEDTSAAVQRAVDQIAAEAAGIVPGLRWQDVGGDTVEGCGNPYDGTAGQVRHLPVRVAEAVVVSRAQWMQIEAAARWIAAAAGAPTAVLVRNSPGNHEVSFVGPAGLSITIGYGGTLAISGTTGCRLPASWK